MLRMKGITGRAVTRVTAITARAGRAIIDKKKLIRGKIEKGNNSNSGFNILLKKTVLNLRNNKPRRNPEEFLVSVERGKKGGFRDVSHPTRRDGSKPEKPRGDRKVNPLTVNEKLVSNLRGASGKTVGYRYFGTSDRRGLDKKPEE